MQINAALGCTCFVALIWYWLMLQLRRSPNGKALWSAREIGLTNWPIIGRFHSSVSGTAWSMATDCILCQTLWHTTYRRSTYIFILSRSIIYTMHMFLERTFQCPASKNNLDCCNKHDRGTRKSLRCFNVALDFGHLAFLQDAPADTCRILHPCISISIHERCIHAEYFPQDPYTVYLPFTRAEVYVWGKRDVGTWVQMRRLQVWSRRLHTYTR